MRKVVLGRSGLEVSAVGFGGIPIQRIDEDDAVRVIRRALDLGVTFIDTAAGYSDSQRKIGRAVEGRREGLVLATKSQERTADGLMRDVERALREMRTDRIDLFQFHMLSSPAWDEVRAPGGALEGALEARDQGKVLHLGFSSHSLDSAVMLVEEPVFETVQFPFNLVTREPADALIPKARRLGLGFIAMKPLCGGQYSDAALAFRFLNGYPDVVPIPGIERAGEIEEIVPIVESGRTLEGDDLARAEEIARSLGRLFCRRCGYCMPCPQGVPIQTCMVFDSFVKRIPAEALRAGTAARIVERAVLCTECRTCEERCPYKLPIVEGVRRALETARAIMGDPPGGGRDG